MYRYAKAEGKENVSEKVSLDGYADGGNVSAFATEAMQWAVATGVIKGEGNSGLLNPQGNVSERSAQQLFPGLQERELPGSASITGYITRSRDMKKHTP